MFVLNVNGNEYKVKFGYNSFCDTDLMDRTEQLLNIFQNTGAENDEDATGLGVLKELFVCVRDLLYVGFRKHNPVESTQDVGDLLDDYHDEATEDDPHSILDLFTKLAGELMNEGFLQDVIQNANKDAKKSKKN